MPAPAAMAMPEEATFLFYGGIKSPSNEYMRGSAPPPAIPVMDRNTSRCQYSVTATVSIHGPAPSIITTASSLIRFTLSARNPIIKDAGPPIMKKDRDRYPPRYKSRSCSPNSNSWAVGKYE